MKKCFPWLAAAAIITVLCGTMYGVTQQAQRSAANDPQIQVAEDVAAAVNNKTYTPSTTAQINLAGSLDTFIVVYDQQGRPTSGTGYLQGALPQAPLGMLQAAKNRPYSTVTWQPQSNVRLAAVTVATRSGYVVAGRSLAEVEKREMRTAQLVAFAWVVCLFFLGSAIFMK